MSPPPVYLEARERTSLVKDSDRTDAERKKPEIASSGRKERKSLEQRGPEEIWAAATPMRGEIVLVKRVKRPAKKRNYPEFRGKAAWLDLRAPSCSISSTTRGISRASRQGIRAKR